MVIGMSVAKSFRDLNVYRLAREAAGEVFRVSKAFPKEERFSLTDQIRRSSRAVNAMLAEAWARRRYKAAFINKIDEALGEAMETQAWLDHALDSGYLPQPEFAALDAKCRSVSAMLARMIDRAGDFCKNASDTDYRAVRAIEGDPPITTH
jgi:four helix bundle protein